MASMYCMSPLRTICPYLQARARLPIVYGLYFWMKCPSTSSPPRTKGLIVITAGQKEAKLQKAGGWDYFLHFCPTYHLHTANWWRRSVICGKYLDSYSFKDSAKSINLIIKHVTSPIWSVQSKVPKPLQSHPNSSPTFPGCCKSFQLD